MFTGLLVPLIVSLAMETEPSLEAAAPAAGTASTVRPARIISLDGGAWLLAPDPADSGRREAWFEAPRPEAKPTRVPWIIQDALPGYHGVAWYWRDFEVPEHFHPEGCFLLRFWAVDYKADVWINGAPAGSHEGGESPFVLDVTKTVRPAAVNRLAVRVLNPTHEPIDGIVLDQTPHRNKALPYRAGSAWNQGGIMDSVELLLAPPVRISDLFVRPEWPAGILRIHLALRSDLPRSARRRIEIAVAPAASGETLLMAALSREIPSGESAVESRLRLPQPRAWDLDDPFLYRVTARLLADDHLPADQMDEISVRCGLRDFRFERGSFRLNGRRIYLRCSHTGNCCPIGLELPHDPDFLRRDLINAKAMRFNAIRFIAGVPKRYQLDLCDEIGLMVYEESYAAWCLASSPRMAERYDESVLGMVRRDRNHPSVVIWGLLNETPDGPVFRHAVSLLPRLRELDDSRLVLLNSGRWDAAASGQIAGIEVWRPAGRIDPCVTRNGTTRTIRALGITWAPGQLAFHPGQRGEYAVVRWTAPADDAVQVTAVFQSIAERATTDVHVLHGGRELFAGGIHVLGGGGEQRFEGRIAVRAGDALDFCCGFGNGDYGADTTALDVTIQPSLGVGASAAAEFTAGGNPSGPWSYGLLAPGDSPDAATFQRFDAGLVEAPVGGVSNPGSARWEDLLSDKHPYQRVPHTADIIRALRTMDGDGLPLFISEYGIGSAVDLMRVVNLYEQAGKPDVEDALFYRAQRDRFLEDWKRWRLDEAFDRPEEFFAQSNARMAGQRLLGLNAIRSNPAVVGYSLTGTVDQGMTGEGLWTTFRELKPGTADAVFDGFAPLRWCLFAEPVNVYRGTPVRIEALLASEDALPPGEYSVWLRVVGPGKIRVFERQARVSIAEDAGGAEPPMVQPVLSESVVIDGPAGAYRFSATFEEGAAAAGEVVKFFVDDPAAMPPLDEEIVLWGDDALLARWLEARNVRGAGLDASAAGRPQVILAAARPAAPGGAAVFRDLAERIARGSAVVFLSPSVFASEADPVAWMPLESKGALRSLPSWLYHTDEWCKPHAIFDGLPRGGLMDYTFYRELIPDAAWTDLDPPEEAVAGAINASQGYSSGLLVSVHRLGAGHFILNTLSIREHLEHHPAAERLLRNLLRHAASLRRPEPAALPADWDEFLRRIRYE